MMPQGIERDRGSDKLRSETGNTDRIIVAASTLVAMIVLLTSRFLGQIPESLNNWLAVAGALTMVFVDLPRGGVQFHLSEATGLRRLYL